MSELRELAREEPGAVRSVAERVGGEAGEWLQRILDEEQGTKTSPSGYVYLAEASPGVVKIGFSRSPEQRINSLDTANPEDVVLLEAVELSDARGAEKRLHREFSGFKMSGEWFDLGEERRDALVKRLNRLRGIDEGGGV